MLATTLKDYEYGRAVLHLQNKCPFCPLALLPKEGLAGLRLESTTADAACADTEDFCWAEGDS